MNSHAIGRLHRLLRQRAGLTQQQLSTRCGVARWKIVRLEADRLDQLRFGDVERCLAELDARLDVRGWYHGAAGDRLLDERHAQLVSALVELLRRYGWEVRVEVSFASRGDRGSIDVLAWHARTRTLLVCEVKSELGAIEGTLRPFDIKCRLAASIARERFAWHAAAIGRIVILPEDRTQRRAVERHEAVLRAALPASSREIKTWLGSPSGAIGGIWFLTDVPHINAKRNPSSIRRVRQARPRSIQRTLPDASARRTPGDPLNVEMPHK